MMSSTQDNRWWVISDNEVRSLHGYGSPTVCLSDALSQRQVDKRSTSLNDRLRSSRLGLCFEEANVHVAIKRALRMAHSFVNIHFLAHCIAETHQLTYIMRSFIPVMAMKAKV